MQRRLHVLLITCTMALNQTEEQCQQTPVWLQLNTDGLKGCVRPQLYTLPRRPFETENYIFTGRYIINTK